MSNGIKHLIGYRMRGGRKFVQKLCGRTLWKYSNKGEGPICQNQVKLKQWTKDKGHTHQTHVKSEYISNCQPLGSRAESWGHQQYGNLMSGLHQLSLKFSWSDQKISNKTLLISPMSLIGYLVIQLDDLSPLSIRSVLEIRTFFLVPSIFLFFSAPPSPAGALSLENLSSQWSPGRWIEDISILGCSDNFMK